MILGSFLALGLLAAPQTPAPTNTKAPQPLAFSSQKLPYAWDRLLPLKMEVDGIKLNTIFFNRREVAKGPLKGATFGVRAQVEVSNTSTKPRSVGFAVAVFDADGRLLGVASGGTKYRALRPNTTDEYDLDFAYVLERLPKGDHFVLSVELGD